MFEQTITLTPREKECVNWLLFGETGVTIAEKLGISEMTVNQHIKSAMKKMRCRTRVQLAARFIQDGLVEDNNSEEI